MGSSTEFSKLGICSGVFSLTSSWYFRKAQVSICQHYEDVSDTSPSLKKQETPIFKEVNCAQFLHKWERSLYVTISM